MRRLLLPLHDDAKTTPSTTTDDDAKTTPWASEPDEGSYCEYLDADADCERRTCFLPCHDIYLSLTYRFDLYLICIFVCFSHHSNDWIQLASSGFMERQEFLDRRVRCENGCTCKWVECTPRFLHFCPCLAHDLFTQQCLHECCFTLSVVFTTRRTRTFSQDQLLW